MSADLRPCPHATGPSHATHRWLLAWSHRDDLLAIARRRTPTAHDAEDVVQEAIVRAAEQPDLDEDRIGAWLNRVVVNLCTDVHREAGHARQRVAYAARHAVTEPSPEEAVVARVAAAHACAGLHALPERQREALLMKADGLSVHDVAARMGVGYKTVESLLSRGRGALRGRRPGSPGGPHRHVRARHTATGGETVVVLAVAGRVPARGTKAPPAPEPFSP